MGCVYLVVLQDKPLKYHTKEKRLKIKAYKLQVENILIIDAWKEKSQGKKLSP